MLGIKLLILYFKLILPGLLNCGSMIPELSKHTQIAELLVGFLSILYLFFFFFNHYCFHVVEM